MPLVHVDDLADPPEVGKTYLVNSIFSSATGRPVAVFGPRHDDLELLRVGDHYHVDVRFLEPAAVPVVMAQCLQALGRPMEAYLMAVAGQSLVTPQMLPALFGFVLPVVGDGSASPRPFLCHREMPPYPVEMAAWLPVLEAQYQGQQLTERGRCPHRGLPVAGAVQRDADGVRRCVGHGLCFDGQGKVLQTCRRDGT